MTPAGKLIVVICYRQIFLDYDAIRAFIRLPQRSVALIQINLKRIISLDIRHLATRVHLFQFFVREFQHSNADTRLNGCDWFEWIT